MELKILIFSIALQGSSISKTILFNDKEYISIENYFIENSDTTFRKIVYYEYGADSLVEFADGKITFTPSKFYQPGSWTIPGEKPEGWTTTIKTIDSEQIELLKTSSYHREERSKLKKTNLNRQLSETISFIQEHEATLYLTISSSVFRNKCEIFRVDLVREDFATMEEIEAFNIYKNQLKQF